MQIIKDWKKFPKFYSVHAYILQGAILAGWDKLPAKFQDAFPFWAVLALAVITLVAGIFARLIDQGLSNDKQN